MNLLNEITRFTCNLFDDDDRDPEFFGMHEVGRRGDALPFIGDVARQIADEDGDGDDEFVYRPNAPIEGPLPRRSADPPAAKPIFCSVIPPFTNRPTKRGMYQRTRSLPADSLRECKPRRDSNWKDSGAERQFVRHTGRRGRIMTIRDPALVDNDAIG
ncbi:MAG TPA: hypothetical protein VMX18_02270 [Candidatus Bipolaricaulota bacterium]|nr:hypothetical protein [Candidatus Bipolaricaulota bacterium]